MNLLVFDNGKFDIKANGDGTFRAVIEVPGCTSGTSLPVKVTIPRCSIKFEPYTVKDNIVNPYMVEIECDESHELFQYSICERCKCVNINVICGGEK